MTWTSVFIHRMGERNHGRDKGEPVEGVIDKFSSHGSGSHLSQAHEKVRKIWEADRGWLNVSG